MFSASKTGAGASGYTIANSLRFQSASSQYLSRTPASAGNRQKWTWSAWVKRGVLGNVTQGLFGSNLNANTGIGFGFSNGGTAGDNFFYTINGVGYAATTAVFRDPSAWYHIVVAFDSTQATAANRFIVYINNVNYAFASNIVVQNNNYDVNNTTAHNLGFAQGLSNYLDGYLAEVNFIDGQALTPSSFGTTDATSGQWVAKKYTGTYGTNGFYLPFSNGTSTTTLGYDSSGNGNNWTLTNFTRSAGVSDCWMYDVPSGNGGASGTQPSSNYAVMNSIGAVLPGGGTNMPNFAAANLTLNGGSAVWRDSGVSTINMKSGKWYVEVTINTLTGGIILGLIDAFNAATVRSYRSNGTKYINATNSAYGSSYSAGNVIGFAIDCDGGTLTCYVNNVSQGALCTDLVSAMPTNGWFFNPQIYSSSSVSVNFGQRSFAYTPPSGYKALCTANLPASTIVKGNQYMDATLYTGNTTTVTVTNAGGFQPDLVWIKDRSQVASHVLTDAVRGATQQLFSNLTNAEQTNSAYVTSFNSNGFTVGVGNTGTGVVNNNGDSFVAWQWDAGSSTVTNTNGTISSQVRANPTAGVSVVTFTKGGTATTKTVGHGLGVAPAMIIAKARNAVDNWPVYHISNGATFYQELNTTIARTSGNPWGNTTPTSTVFSVQDNGTANWVAYCFAAIPSYSKDFSYTGNGSADGVFTYLGFTPKLVLIKRTDTTGNWIMWDTVRNTYNVLGEELYPNLSNAGASSTDLDALSNGFKSRSTNAAFNASGGTYVGFAWATNPFQNSNAF